MWNYKWSLLVNQDLFFKIYYNILLFQISIIHENIHNIHT